MHIINGENYGEANDAVRDILMMYVDMAGSYSGFGHASDVYIRFDPLRFVDAEVAKDGYHYVDLDLLRAGSAIAVLCAFYDLWCEEQPLADHMRTSEYQAAIAAGRFARFPDVEAVIREAIARNTMPLDDPWLEEAVAPIYRKYVTSLFAELSRSDRSSS